MLTACPAPAPGHHCSTPHRSTRIGPAHRRPRPDTRLRTIPDTEAIRAWEESVIPGMLQTADYARAIFLRYAERRGGCRS
ncbi:Scr1 family TA system antitoxin-like transcriptional regulator [Streptomyces sp. NPDC056004]|uniref:Scr1 family TA system antitoxin-like transcriptional regulator n=1 Tax=Streptomyces sp. NPDC056004 TaxID=3345677 RepID=UPI0035E093F2